MRKIQKLIIIIISSITTISVYSQLSDTNCVKSRWIAVKPIEKNKELFSTVKNEKSILFEIKQLSENKKLTIYDEENNYINKGEWYPIPYFKYEINPKNGDTIDSEKITDRFQISIQATNPLSNHYGEDSTITLSDGTILIVYPESKKYDIKISEISEIRIKEIRVLNIQKNIYEFEPVGISFCSNERELFWVSLKDLNNQIKDSKNIYWYNLIKNKQYYGFQYLQVSCYDDVIRY